MTTIQEADDDEDDIQAVEVKIGDALFAEDKFTPVLVALIRTVAHGVATINLTKVERAKLLEDVIKDLRLYFEQYTAERDASLNS